MMRDELTRLRTWIAPFLAAAFLGAAAVLGLYVASRAADTASYVIGFALTALALIALGWGFKRFLDGEMNGLPITVLVEDTIALLILVAALGILSMVGLFLAADAAGAARNAGYGLFVVSAAAIFVELKHYFDAEDRAKD